MVEDMCHLRPILVLAAACAAASTIAPAALAGTSSFALRPVMYDPAIPATKSYFVLDPAPGTTVQSSVRVTNVGSGPGVIRLYAVDGTTGQTSGAVYRSVSAPRRDVGAWITLGARRLALGPGKSAVVPFTVRIPVGARGGDHLGGIVGENASLTSGGEGAIRVKIQHLTIAAVLVRLPGAPVARLSLDRAAASGGNGYQYVNLDLANRGTIMMKPVGSMTLRTADGTLIASRKLALDTFLPRTQIRYPVVLPRQVLKPGRYVASVALEYGNRVLEGSDGVGGPLRLSRTLSFRVIPQETASVYVGAPQLHAPARGHRSSISAPLAVAWVLAGAALLAALSFGYAVRRRAVRV